MKAENKKLSDENTELKKTVKKQSYELAEYKKPATMSIKVLKAQDRKIKERESIKFQLNKAMSFIEACGLYDEYQRFRQNTKNINYGLE